MKMAASLKSLLAITLIVFMLPAAEQAFAQGQGGGRAKKEKKEKKANKSADKLAKTAEKAENQLGRDVVFCILAAHTDVGTAEELRTKYNYLVAELGKFPFGQFVAAVIMADRIGDEDFDLDEILAKLKEGLSIGKIAKEADVNVGELRRGFGEFRSELARSITNPPTKDCFATSP